MGDSIFPGQSTLGAAIGGIKTADRLFREIGRVRPDVKTSRFGQLPGRKHPREYLPMHSTPDTSSEITLSGAENPLLQTFRAAFGAPPFDQIEPRHFLSAFEEAMATQKREVEAILLESADPDFANTIEALERSGLLLETLDNLISSLNSADTTPELQEIIARVASSLAQHSDDLLLDPRLFDRIKAVVESQDRESLSQVQQRLLDQTWREFIRGGANLADADKEKLRRYNQRLAILSQQFYKKVLAEDNAFELVIDKEEDLAGLPPGSRYAAARAAEERGHAGGWVFTLHKPSLIPFLQYAERRELREKIYQAYVQRGNHDDQNDTKAIIREIVLLRSQRARLLGYESHAHMVLEENMAEAPEKVDALLRRLWTPALERAKNERAEMQALIDQEGGGFRLAPWDWWFYAERIRSQRYDFDEEELRPYFALERVRDGAFLVAERLFGIQFHRLSDIPTYHEEVEVFEVRDGDGSHLALFYCDFHPRPSKRGGAWMATFRDQWTPADGDDIRPLVTNVCNFTRPTGDQPALLSLEEVYTLFHEFGHALHGMLTRCTYRSHSGTEVSRDFVELPSQLFENWATAPEVLALYARHHATGAVIPTELVEKMTRARQFNQGFATTEYLAASFLDMAWHTVVTDEELDVHTFESAVVEELGLIPEIAPRYHSTNFSHIFGGGYASGYYSYVWAEVLDADTFHAFEEAGIFDPELAFSYRKNILEAGDTRPPMELYRRFRGADPSIEPLLERRGLAAP